MTNSEILRLMQSAVEIKVIYRGEEQAVQNLSLTGEQFKHILEEAGYEQLSESN